MAGNFKMLKEHTSREKSYRIPGKRRGSCPERRENARLAHCNVVQTRTGLIGTAIFSGRGLSDLLATLASAFSGRAEAHDINLAAQAKRLSLDYVYCIKPVIRFAGQFV
jgi:hypothetical protein